jgi:hypothetical protein
MLSINVHNAIKTQALTIISHTHSPTKCALFTADLIFLCKKKCLTTWRLALPFRWYPCPIRPPVLPTNRTLSSLLMLLFSKNLINNPTTIKSPKTYVKVLNLMSVFCCSLQRIRPSPRPSVRFRTKPVLLYWEFVRPPPKLKVVGHPLSAIAYTLSYTFTAIPLLKVISSNSNLK